MKKADFREVVLMRAKRIIVSILVIGLAFTMLTACDNDEPDPIPEPIEIPDEEPALSAPLVDWREVRNEWNAFIEEFNKIKEAVENFPDEFFIDELYQAAEELNELSYEVNDFLALIDENDGFEGMECSDLDAISDFAVKSKPKLAQFRDVIQLAETKAAEAEAVEEVIYILYDLDYIYEFINEAFFGVSDQHERIGLGISEDGTYAIMFFETPEHSVIFL